VVTPETTVQISSGSGANAQQNSSYKWLFLQNCRFNREKTVQFSGPVPCPGKQQFTGCPVSPVPSGIPWRPKNFRAGTVLWVFFDLTGLSRIWQGNQGRKPGMGIPANPFSSMFLSY